MKMTRITKYVYFKIGQQNHCRYKNVKNGKNANFSFDNLEILIFGFLIEQIKKLIDNDIFTSSQDITCVLDN